VLSSRRASEADVALPLIDLLVAAGATLDVDDPDLLCLPLLNEAPETAEALIRRGAAIDIRHAAALGRLETLAALLVMPVERGPLEEALVYACIHGRTAAASLLLRHGATGDVLVTPGARTPRTALHEAANRGHAGVVRLLLDNGADAGVIEPRWGGTAADWAYHGGHPRLTAMLRSRGGTDG
jgi:ankyrin repeat protein